MPWNYVISYFDAYGRSTTRTYGLAVADYTAARLRADSVLAALQNISELGIFKDSLQEVSAISGSAAAASNVDEGATLTWDIGSFKKASQAIPGPVKAIFNADSTVDLANAAVLAWEVEMVSGEVTISDGEVAINLVRGTLDK